MSEHSALVVKPVTTLVRQETPAEVKARLEAARVRMKASLDGLERELGAVGRWRELVRKHPLLTVGGVLVAGYLVGRWWGRK